MNLPPVNPCPSCGSKEWVVISDRMGSHVECESCCEHGPNAYSKREAIKEWNLDATQDDWRAATCGECAWKIDMPSYPMCRRFHLDVQCDHQACPAFVRRSQ
jgi:hypothetical protein